MNTIGCTPRPDPAGGATPRQSLRSIARLVVLSGAVALPLCGCKMMDKVSGADAARDKRANQVQELQLGVMRFADMYVGGVVEPVQAFQVSTHDPAERLIAQNWMVSQSTSAYTIATGPNPVTNALDMVVLATLSRMVIEDSWVNNSIGKRALPLLDAYRRLEPQARALLDGVLTPAQQTQLDGVIKDWRERNPDVRYVSYVHFADFARSIGRPGDKDEQGGLFQLLGIDPLSNLDPAVREIAQSRQLAERAIYYAQRAPNLLDMQFELLTNRLVAMPETKRVLEDTAHLGGAAASAGRLVDDLPNLLAREREAAIRQVMDAINLQAGQMSQLADELRAALDAGTATSDSLNTTIRSADQLIARFDKPKPAGASEQPRGRAFDITEYTAAAAGFARTANELQQLLATVERGAPTLAQSADRAANGLQTMIDHLLWRATLLGLLLIVSAFGSALAYRYCTRRIPRQPAKDAIP